MGAIADTLRESRDRTEQAVFRHRAAVPSRQSLMAGGGVVLGESQLSTGLFGEGAVEREMYGHYRGWTYAAIRPIAQTIAGQPVGVGRELGPMERPRSGRLATKASLPGWLKQAEVEQYETHPLLDAIANPNPVMTRWHLLYILIASLEIAGEHLWWIVAGEDGPVIWPVPSLWFEPVHRDRKPFAAWSITPGGQGEPEEIPNDEVVYFHYPDLADPLGCTSPAMTQSRAMSADEAMQDAQANTFLNAPFPKHALVVGDVTEDGENLGRPVLEHGQRQQLYAEFKRLYTQTAQYGLPIILDRLIHDIKPLSNKPNEMDFTDSGKVTKDRIFLGHGTNPVIAGEIEKVNRASSYAARRHFADHTVNPKIELVSEVLTRSLGPIVAVEGERLRVWIEPYVPDDRDERRRDLDLAAKYGSVTKDELRGALTHLNLEPMDGGDAVAAPPMPLPAVVSSGKSADEPPDISMALDQEARVKAWLKAHSRHEAGLLEAVHTLFLEQRDSVTARLYEVLGELEKAAGDAGGLVEVIFDPDEWEERLVEVCRPHLERAAAVGAVRTMEQVKATKAGPSAEELMVELTPAVRAKIDGELETLLSRPYWPDVQQTTRAKLAATLSEGVQNGESLHYLAARVGDAPTVPVVDPGVFPPGTVFGTNAVLGSEASRRRALLIARTEVTGALNCGQAAQQEQLFNDGVTDGMEWMAIIDQYTRGSHAALNGARAPGDYPVGKWDVGGHVAPYPGHHSLPAAERCNCILPGQLVEGRFIAGTKAYYGGQVCEIITRGGRRLTVTPQHRILTEDGFVAAGSLHQGEKLLAYNVQAEGPGFISVGRDQIYHEPALIEDVFEALRLAADVSDKGLVERRRGLPDDFHGDGRGLRGEVEVVWADGSLLLEGIPRPIEKGVEDIFPGVDLGLGRVSASCSVGDGRIASDARGACIAGIGQLGLGLPSSTALAKDSRTVALECLPLDEFSFGSASHLDAAFPEAIKEDVAAVAGLVADLLERLPGLVLLDEVVEVRNRNFTGHVYDLQSVNGLIITEGIGISNCRCTLAPVVE